MWRPEKAQSRWTGCWGVVGSSAQVAVRAAARGLGSGSPVGAAQGGSTQAGAVPGEARGLLLPTARSRHSGAAENSEQVSRAGWSRSQ